MCSHAPRTVDTSCSLLDSEASLFCASGALLGAAFGGPVGCLAAGALVGGLYLASDPVIAEGDDDALGEQGALDLLVVYVPVCVALVLWKVFCDFGIKPAAPGGFVAAGLLLLAAKGLGVDK